MAESIPLLGFVNTEEVLADTIRQQTPDVLVDGYALFPNRAFERTVNNAYRLYEEDEQAPSQHYLSRLALSQYGAINLGPDTAVQLLEDQLQSNGIPYVGARAKELVFELDKTKIFEIFPNNTGILPPTRILETSSDATIKEALEYVGGDAVIKFVGDYSSYYNDSEYRRVRLASEFRDAADLSLFIKNSVASSGHAIIQKRIAGQEFSYTCMVDKNFGQFRLGENIFYKRRFENDKGPLCDGTGSVSVSNTLPGILSSKDIDFIQNDIVYRYAEKIAAATGRPPRTFLNLDFMKDADGNIYLIEINHRQPGGHTMSTLLAGMDTPIAEALFAAQEDRLSEVEAKYKKGATLAVTVFPEISPNDFNETDQKPVVTIPRNQKEDKTRLYTGWVNVLEDLDDYARVESNLTATIIAATHEASLEQARTATYAKLSRLSLDHTGLTFRRDIGLYVPGLVAN